ncbi:hypothetical protein [Streptomyces europaeiscabiei]|uniref:hypothetical protein n=1 Tax=Streptomyces europaeiscabiei TaxID=146819 RepID=UPI00131E69CC|nr:hypothetical protein [Streptomyces europaeiscabiei]MDX3673348.1 hypothetical protein [Streptomyces europaeiscabiei]
MTDNERDRFFEALEDQRLKRERAEAAEYRTAIEGEKTIKGPRVSAARQKVSPTL